MRCLDATLLIDLLRRSPAAEAKVRELEQEGALVTTEIGAFELYLGIHRLESRRRGVEAARIADLLAQMDVLPFERRSAIHAAEIAGELRRRGETIGLADLFTAAVARGHGADTVVTRDVEAFRRVRDLRVESY